MRERITVKVPRLISPHKPVAQSTIVPAGATVVLLSIRRIIHHHGVHHHVLGGWHINL